MPAIHLLIKGKVQGVFYRASARDVAERLGLSGWIKNTLDGHVEALVSGPQAALDQFVDWCHQGPRGAEVKAVEVSPAQEPEEAGFRVIRGIS